jgi:hypothetical protein
MTVSPDFLSNLLSSIFGTIIGAILAYFFAARQFKIQKEVEIQQKQIETALAYHQELSSNDFSYARTETNKIFEEHMDASNLDDFYSNLPEESRKCIRIVTAYFRRLQLAIEYKQINNKMVLDLLSGEFFWWYFMWLNKMIPEHWDTRKNIDKLNTWLQRAMPAIKYEQLKKVTLTRREKRLFELHSNQ